MEEFLSSSFIRVPESIVRNYQLSAGAKLLFAEILSLSQRYGFCFASNEYLGTCTSLTSRTVSKRIKELKEENLIEIENPKGRNRKIYVNDLCQYD